MGTRTVALLTALAAVPSVALADRHTMECFVMGTLSKAESDTDTEEDSDDDLVAQRVAVNCAYVGAGEVEGATRGDPDAGRLFPTVEARVDTSAAGELLLGLMYVDGWRRVQPFVRAGVGGIRTAGGGDDFGLGLVVGGGVDLVLKDCPRPPAHCGTAAAVRAQLDLVTVWAGPVRSFPRASFGLGLRLGE